MTDTTFVDKSTTIATAWLQDVNDLTYGGIAMSSAGYAVLTGSYPGYTMVATESGAETGADGFALYDHAGVLRQYYWASMDTATAGNVDSYNLYLKNASNVGVTSMKIKDGIIKIGSDGIYTAAAPVDANDLANKDYVDGASDSRIKDNITPYSGAADVIKQMAVYEFDYNEKSPKNGNHSIGVIAQELQALLPDLVHSQVSYESDGEEEVIVGKDKNGKDIKHTRPKLKKKKKADQLLYLDRDGLLGVALQAIKELTQRLEALENP